MYWKTSYHIEFLAIEADMKSICQGGNMWMKAWKTNGLKFFCVNPVLASTLVCLMGWFYKLNRDNYIQSKSNLKKEYLSNIFSTKCLCKYPCKSSGSFDPINYIHSYVYSEVLTLHGMSAAFFISLHIT